MTTSSPIGAPAPRKVAALWAAALLGLGAFAASCTDDAPKAAAPDAPLAVTLRGETMGTTYSVKVVVPTSRSGEVPPLQVDVDRALAEVNAAMSTYDPKSEISRFNASPAAAPATISPDFARVVTLALETGKKTEGAFDITLGPLIALWGFDKDGRRDTPPSPDAITAARARTGLDKVALAGTTLTKTRDDVEINLSAVAKGFAVDKVAALLAAKGYRDLMVEIGGEVVARGVNDRGAPWVIGVNVPKADADPTAVLRPVSLENRALATSGSYRNFFEAGGQRYSHIIDPRTAAPVEHDLVSVTLLAPDCAQADALATAALVLGEDKTRALLKDLPGTEALFVHARGDGSEVQDLKVTTTAGFPATR